MDKVILGLIPSMPNEAALYRYRNHWGYGYAANLYLHSSGKPENTTELKLE
jgi:hypothetical protein